MKGSLFRKYLMVSSSIILVSFVIMGAVISFSMSQYWVNEKLSSLMDSARSMSAIASYRAEQSSPIYNSINTQLVFSAMAPSLNADAYVTDAEGKIVVSAHVQEDHPTATHMDLSMVQDAMDGGYSGITRLKDFYPTEQYVVGVPLQRTDQNGVTHVIGAVFLASSAQNFHEFRNDIIQMCIISAIFAAAISFLFSGAMTYRLVMPLREMSEAALAFGKGDFSRRVPVRGSDEMSGLAAAFNSMATSLAESENISRSFVANISHELKTPMTTIAGFINGILDGTIPPERHDHYLRIVSNEVLRLSRLVKSMLDLSRIDSGEMVLRRSDFDLQETVFNTMLSFEKLIEDRKIEVAGMEDCRSVRVNGDADMMYQVVYNLVENAVKFTPERGTITVSVFEKGGRAHVTIRNTGAGISQEELPLVFGRFYKTDKSRSSDKNGMGLGLYIVRTIIQLHGGDIEVRSREGEYCEFEFYIPALSESGSLKKKTTERNI